MDDNCGNYCPGHYILRHLVCNFIRRNPTLFLTPVQDSDGICVPFMLGVRVSSSEDIQSRKPAFVIVNWLIRLHKSYIFGGAPLSKKVFAI
jgi:hypothetical protein